MRWTLAALIGMGGLLLAGCGGQASDGSVAVRIASVFEDDPEGVPVERSAPLPRVEWRFDTPEGQKSERSATRGWKAAQGVSGLTVREGRLTGRTTSAVPVIHVERSAGPFDADPLHAIELRMRVSTGTTLAVIFDAEPELEVEAVVARAQAFQQQATTPLIPGDALQTYTLRLPRSLAASGIRHVLLQPTDEAGASFELESLRLIFRREHLAGIPPGFSWQGLAGIFMETLVTRSPERVEVELALPTRPWLDLSVGTVEDDAVTFRVVARASSGPDARETLLLERTVTTPHQWESTPIDLSALAGEELRLVFSVAADQAGAIGFWGSPVVRSSQAMPTPARPPANGFAARPPQGVIVIWADTLRSDHLDVYGYERKTAPVLAATAREGALFRNCVVQATWTKVSTPSMMTGLYPTSHGVKNLLDRIPAAATTISEVYQNAGYATFSYASNLFTGQFTNLHQGFDVVHEAQSLPDPESSKTTRLGMDRLFPWLEVHRDVPFFVFLSILDPHDPYKPLPPYDSLWADPSKEAEHERNTERVREHIANPILKQFAMPSRKDLIAAGVDPDKYVAFDRDWYDGSIRGMDTELRRLLERLRSLGLDEKTLVVFTSDHGEEFLEHGRMFHGLSAYGEVSRVPLVMRWPGTLSAGLEIEEPVEIIDLMPTLLELSRLSGPEPQQGRSLLPLLSGERQGWTSRPVIIEKWAVVNLEKPPFDTNSAAIAAGGWKLVHNFKRLPDMPEYELYEFVKDPLDRVDLAAAHPDVVARLSKELQSWRERAEAERLPSDADAADSLSAEDLKRLKALGYIE